MTEKEHRSLAAILRDTLHEIDESYDLRKNEPVMISLKTHIDEVIASWELSADLEEIRTANQSRS